VPEAQSQLPGPVLSQLVPNTVRVSSLFVVRDCQVSTDNRTSLLARQDESQLPDVDSVSLGPTAIHLMRNGGWAHDVAHEV